MPPGLPAAKATLLAVGDELLGGRVLERHSAHASQQLAILGIQTSAHITVGDAPGELSRWLRRLASESDLILITGGIGPTEDDRTRDEVAAAAGVESEFREESWDRIRRRFGDRLRSPERNRRQAFFPAGAEEIENPYGTAPGFVMPHVPPAVPSRLGWWVLPGVPREFEGLFREVLLPRVRLAGSALEERDVFRLFGVSESVLDGWLIERVPTERREDYHVCVADGEIEVHMPTSIHLEPDLRGEFGESLLGRGPQRLAERLVEAARSKSLRFAIAESCTGGAAASRVVGVSGASDCFDRGWVTYSNRAKTEELGVPPDLLAAHGAVSEEVAVSMAEGARASAGADIAVSITGIAGPDGGTPEKPVGTVWFGLAERGATTTARRLLLPGDRERVRALAAQHALFAILRCVAARDDDEPSDIR